MDKLRGIEGYSAKAYFGSFSAMVRTHRDTFEFVERSKRPPKDPINALLSFVYTLLANECVAACEGAGLDPQMGFLQTKKIPQQITGGMCQGSSTRLNMQVCPGNIRKKLKQK
ncbi:MAG: CRISPR-associated endonuclease Cas1 [Cyanobacteria bacterium J06635_1]